MPVRTGSWRAEERISLSFTKPSDAALIREVGAMPEGSMQALTRDRGSERVQRKRFTSCTAVKNVFCDPRSPWQRGTNEIPTVSCVSISRTANLDQFSQDDLNVIAHKLITCPGKTLVYTAPIDKLAESSRSSEKVRSQAFNRARLPRMSRLQWRLFPDALPCARGSGRAPSPWPRIRQYRPRAAAMPPGRFPTGWHPCTKQHRC